jgi:1-phosphofructokinase
VILTLTPNPSVDQTIVLDGALARGGVHRAASVTSQAGGKGVNISRACVAAGVPTLAVLPADEDDPFVLELLAAGIDCRPVPPAGPVRVNVTVTEPDGTTTKLNSPGADAEPEHLEAMVDAVLARARGAAWTVLAGSLPAGAPDDFYAGLVQRLAGTSRVAVDTSEAPLGALVDTAHGALPDLMKPNGEELASLTGQAVAALEEDPEKAAIAAATLVEAGVGAVLATLGARGAVLVTASGSWYAAPPPTAVLSTVGAGDSSLFGYLLAETRGRPEPERLALAVAYGSAAAGLPGTTIPTPEQVDPAQVTVRSVGRPLDQRPTPAAPR